MDSITGDCVDLEEVQPELKELKRKPDSSPDASTLKKKCNKENLSPTKEEVICP